MKVDVLVIGAGPAGCAAALGALTQDPSLRVVLLDRSDFPRDKSCGDGIAPHVVTALAEVGAEDVVDGWRPLRRLELARGPVRVEGDPHQLSRLVRNLVDNATRHARSTIGLRLYAEDGQAVIEVAEAIPFAEIERQMRPNRA